MTKIILKEWKPESEPDCSNCKYEREELEKQKHYDTDLVNEFVNGMTEAASEVFDFANTLGGEPKVFVRRAGNRILNRIKSCLIDNGWTPTTTQTLQLQEPRK